MAKKHSRTGKLFTIIFVLLIAACLLLTASSYGFLPSGFPSWETIFGKSEQAAEDVFANSGKTADNDNTASVHFIDCGQGDCEAIVSNGTLTVIDSGPTKNANSTLNYIKSLGFSKIDNLVLTHAHEDHIGGAKQLVENFQIGTIYMSKPKSGTEPNTEVYRQLLKAIAAKGLKITTAKTGMTFDAGAFSMQIISPSKEYDELNDQSAVIHAVYDDVSFLFTGDAESEPMNTMLGSYYSSLESTVLKVGHHGSKTSTTKKWLAAVQPQYAVISCEQGNDYGHPHGAVLQLLDDANAKVYRTDLSGSIIMKTDGKTVSVTAEREE
ncbi:MAG: ComEC/Rec2 family competence protein [Acutalibacteraceae bacterium]